MEDRGDIIEQSRIILDHLLTIDDDEVSNILVKMAAMNRVKNISSITSGWEALDFLLKCHNSDDFPELILLDLNMPEMSGFEFLEKYEHLFFKQYPHTKIILATDFPKGYQLEKSSLFDSVSLFVAKPLNEQKISYIIQNVFKEFH